MGAVAQDAEGDVVSEGGVPGIEGSGTGEEEVGGIAAGIDLAEDVEGEAAGGQRGLRFNAETRRMRGGRGEDMRYWAFGISR